MGSSIDKSRFETSALNWSFSEKTAVGFMTCISDRTELTFY